MSGNSGDHKLLPTGMKFELTILGSNSATPAYGRNQTAQILNIHDTLILIDCGEGTQLRLQKFKIRRNKIRYIFISHLHGDHYLGLVGLLSSMHLSGRNDAIYIYGPPALEEILHMHFLHAQTTLRYPLHFQATQDEIPQKLMETKDFKVESFPLNHRIACTGFRFTEAGNLPKIDMDKIKQLGLEIPREFFPLLKRGHDYTDKQGRTCSAAALTTPPAPPRSYAYCSDTLADKSYLEAIKGVDLLYHEATFMQEMEDRAAETFHSTSIQAAEVARDAGVKELLIGHFSARNKYLEPLLEESKQVFHHTALAIEGKSFTVPH